MPEPSSIDRLLPAGIRSVLEERLWRRVGEGSTVEALHHDDALVSAPAEHPALFADDGIVHARDIAAGVVDLATTAEGVVLPLRPADRSDFVVGLAVLLTYVHDVGMHDATPTGRRIHAQYAAHVPFSGVIDDVIDGLLDDDGPVARRIVAVNAAAPFVVDPDVVLRELVSLAVAHSKSTVPSALLGDFAALRKVLQLVVLTDLERHRSAEGAGTGRPVAGRARRERTMVRRRRRRGIRLARLASPAHRALADDAVDAVRLLRAADALSQRGTTLRTAAEYEIFIDAETGAAVFALRTASNDRLLLLRVDSPLSAGEANLRGAFVTSHGDLRIAFHRGRFSSPTAAAVACDGRTGRADIAADVLGGPPSGVCRRICRPRAAIRQRCGSSSSGHPTTRRSRTRSPRRSPVTMQASARESQSSPTSRARRRASGFATAADRGTRGERRGGRHPARACCSWHEGGGDRQQQGVRGRAADSPRGRRGSRRGGVVAGVRVHPARAGTACTAPWRIPGRRRARVVADRHHRVVRRAERNSRVVASAPVEVLMIPGELFTRRWSTLMRCTRSPRCSRRSARLTASLGLVERVAALHRVDLFARVPGSRARRRGRGAVRSARGDRGVLIEEGAVEAHLFAIVEGRVRVHRGEQTLVELGPGTTVGELAALVPSRAQRRSRPSSRRWPFVSTRPFWMSSSSNWPELAHGVIDALVARLVAAADYADRTR